MNPPVIPSQGPLEGDLTIIELVVKNAKKLFDNPGAADKYCTLADNFGQNNGPKLEEFESEVFPSSIVLWLGRFKKNKDRIGFSLSLDAIEIKGGTEIFDRTLLIGSGKGILAWTKEEFQQDHPEKYNLIFTLTNDVGVSKQIIIDPKLKPGSKLSYKLLIHNIKSMRHNDALRTALMETFKKFNKGS